MGLRKRGPIRFGGNLDAAPRKDHYGEDGGTRKRWNEEETVLALYLYFQLPFGKLHSGNPEIQQLAAAIGRSGLIASHIKPWGQDVENRHNPANGLLLSATLDPAFDRGLITVDRSRRIEVSKQLRESQSRDTRDYFRQFERATLRPSIRFDPDPAFLDWHSGDWFVDRRAA